MKLRIWRRFGLILFKLLLPFGRVYARLTKPRARVLMICGNEVLLVENWLSSGKWSLPGGGLEATESPKQAAIREVHEELGLTLEPNAVHDMGTHTVKQKGDVTSKYHLFSVVLPGKPQLQLRQYEIMNYIWMPLDECMSPQNEDRISRSAVQSVVVWSESSHLV